MKTCSKCSVEQPLDCFYHENVIRKGKPAIHVRSVCSSCERKRRRKYYRTTDQAKRYHLSTKYGITPEYKEALLESQEGLCAICKTDTPGGRYNTFHVDHCHDTGVVRGLLCWECNAGLGKLNTIDKLSSAIQYLEQSMQQE
jgi:hypothetical protein